MTNEELARGCKGAGEQCIALAESLSAAGVSGPAIGIGMLTAAIGILVTNAFQAEDILAAVAEILQQAKDIKR